MMRRLCFLVPSLESAHGVVGDLRRAGMADSNLYVVAREGSPLGDLPDAGLIAKSDFYPQLERGLAMGGAIGLIGTGFSGLLSAIAGSSFPNSRLAEFEQAIEAGHA